MEDRYRFRFWLEEEHRWFYFSFETFLTYQNQIQKTLDNGLKIYQCTGMKDDNNILIYEGDIIEIWKMAGNIHKNMFVKWYQNQSSFRLFDIEALGATPQKIPYGDKRSMGAVTSMTIIGNIYENPELLEEGKE